MHINNNRRFAYQLLHLVTKSIAISTYLLILIILLCQWQMILSFIFTVIFSIALIYLALRLWRKAAFLTSPSQRCLSESEVKYQRDKQQIKKELIKITKELVFVLRKRISI